VRITNPLSGLFGKKGDRQPVARPASERAPGPLTPEELARQEKTRQAASQHQGILNQAFAKKLEAADAALTFPEAAADPLAYLGNLEPLGLSPDERKVVREWTRDLAEEMGARAVWNSRLRLKLELRYLATESGLTKGIGRYPGEGKA
jgi:hypothetical protein